MKKLFSLLLLGVSLQVAVNAQPIPEKNNDGTNGQVTLTDNSTLAGSVKDNIRKKGEITLMRDGKKTKYKADDITGVQVAGITYITNNNTFYEVIWQGKTISLLRKASSSSAILYNGTEPVMVSGSEGDIDDHFVKKTPGMVRYTC